MSDDLVAFLRARLDEDEASVQALTVPHQWHTGPGDDPEWTDEELVCMWPPEFHTPYEQDKHWRGLTVSGPELAAYIARHDPARVLAEVEAKRKIVNALEQWSDPTNPAIKYAGAELRRDSLFHVCVALASVYAGHDDYWPEWGTTS